MKNNDILTVAVLGAVAVGGYFLLKKKADEIPVADPAPAPPAPAAETPVVPPASNGVGVSPAAPIVPTFAKQIAMAKKGIAERDAALAAKAAK